MGKYLICFVFQLHGKENKWLFLEKCFPKKFDESTSVSYLPICFDIVHRKHMIGISTNIEVSDVLAEDQYRMTPYWLLVHLTKFWMILIWIYG